MAWTREFPRSMGYYWYRENSEEAPEIIQVTIRHHTGAFVMQTFNDRIGQEPRFVDGEFWSSALAPPRPA